MPFPYNMPKQMPCPHWNFFPVNSVVTTFGAMAGSSPPPSPDQMPYCKVCRALSTQPRPSV